MKGKRYTTEDKIRLLREADCGQRSVADICREANLSEVMFHHWKQQFRHIIINEARRLKALVREKREHQEDAGRGDAQEPRIILHIRKKL